MAMVYETQDDYAISTFLFENEPLKIALEAIANSGFSHVELWGDMVHLDPRIEPDIFQVEQLLSKLHLQAHAMHCPFRNFLQSTDMAEGRVWRKKLWKQALDICSAMEIPIAVIHAMNRDEYNYDYNQLPYVCELLFELSEYSIAQGVKLAVENISSSHIPGNEILCTLSEQTKLFKAIPNLYYCLDIGHVTITNDDMKAEIDSSIDKLITLHIHNNDGKSDRHDLPDTGVIDWPYWYDYLRKKGYDGQFVLEVASGEDSFNRLDSLKRLFIGDCR